MTSLNRDAIELCARMCIEQALEFWNVHGCETTLSVEHLKHGGARVDVQAEYFKAHIRVHSDTETLEEVWELAAHEAAHIALHDLELAERCLWEDGPPNVYLFALERAVSSLTRVFLRHHPYPAQEN